jgi:hypothetical protein
MICLYKSVKKVTTFTEETTQKLGILRLTVVSRQQMLPRRASRERSSLLHYSSSAVARTAVSRPAGPVGRLAVLCILYCEVARCAT